MGLIESILKKRFSKKEIVKEEDVKPKTQEAVRVVDITTTPPGESGPDITGSYTVVGGSGRGGGGGIIVATQGITPAQAQQKELQSGGTPATTTRILSPQQLSIAKRMGTPVQQTPGFTGTVVESNVSNGQEKFVSQKFLIKGKETGRIIINEEGEQVAVVKQPSQFQFQNRSKGTVQDIILGSEGASILETMGVSFPSLQVGSITESNQERMKAREEYMEEKRNMPIKERLGVAWNSAISNEPYYFGGKLVQPKFSIYSPIRVGVELLDIAWEKTGLYARSQKNIPASFLNIPVSTRGFENFVVGAFFLTPVSTTTFQIEKELYSVTRVGVKGVTHQTEAGTTKVEGQFIAQRVGRNVKGIVESETTNLGVTARGNIISKTGLKGVTYKMGVQFPTGRIFTKPGDTFSAVEISQTSTEGMLFSSKSFGSVFSKGTKNPYISQSFGVQQGDIVGQVAATVSKNSNNAISFSMLKMKDTISPSSIVTVSNIPRSSSPRSALILQNIFGKQIAMESAKAGIGAAVSIPFQAPLQFVPLAVVGAANIFSGKREKVTQQVISPKTISIPKITSSPISSSGGGSPAITVIPIQIITPVTPKPQHKHPQSYTQVESQVQIPKQVLVSKQENSQRQNLKQFVIPYQITRQRQIQSLKQGNVLVNRYSIRTIFATPPFKPQGKTQSLLLPIKLSPQKTTFSLGKVPVFSRRFGKWKFLGSYPSSKQAVKVGKEYTLKTLARSFYVGGKQPKSLLPQFKTKKEKGIGQIFIQKTKYPGGSTLGTKSEILEIQSFRKMFGGRKR